MKMRYSLQNIQETYTNGSGLTVRTTQYASANEPINTYFAYDPINQLIEVTDAMGKKTISEYDKAGRRVSVTHPASGKTTFEYEGGGNLVAKQTANLRAENPNKKIRYTYTYNRLDSIVYPNHPENNVRYQYGAPGADFNRAGRLLAIEDGSGRQEFKYGRQGELTELSRTLVIPNQGVANYVTQWQYDSWNRLTSMVYPDGETVSYSYNLGGLLNRVTGSKNSVNTVYVDDIRYDKFEQRTLLKYGNGTQTDYTYNPANRLMSTLKVQKGSTMLMNNAYTYDAVQNITGIVSSNITQGAIGGSMSHQYRYDNLNRLDSAWGSFVGPNSKKADYRLGLSYDNMHNITRKTQDIVQQNLKFTGILSTGYNLSYTYGDNSQQIANIADLMNVPNITYLHEHEKLFLWRIKWKFLEQLIIRLKSLFSLKMIPFG
jgi:YD repeat-containing protein